MLRPITLLASLFISVITFSQNIKFAKAFNETNRFTATIPGKKFILNYNDSLLAQSKENITDETEIETFFFEAIKGKLLALYPNEQSKVIDWAGKFSRGAVAKLANEKKANEELDTLKISARYSVVEIWTNDKDYLYYFADGNDDGNSPTNIFYKKNGNFIFDVDELAISKDTSSIINNFPSIVSFITKNKAVQQPAIEVVESAAGSKLQFGPKNGSIYYLSITKTQADSIKGEKISESGGTAIFSLKQKSQGPVTSPDSPKSANKAADASAAKDTDSAKLVSSTDLTIGSADYKYILKLWTIDAGYYLTLRGPVIDTVRNNNKREIKTLSSDSCVKSEKNISKLEDNENDFIFLANNLVKRVNKTIDTDSDQAYLNKIKIAYVYFKGEVSKNEAVTKIQQFNNDIIKQSHLDEIAKETTTTARVGRLMLKDSVIKIYRNNRIVDSIKIDSITFSIEGGKLSRRTFYVETPKGIFLNKMAPIPVLQIDFHRKRDRLENLDGTNTYVKLGEIVRYKPDAGYLPDDVDNLVLTPEKKSRDLSVANNLNSMVNFSMYTDLAGLLGRRANGLLITDVTGKFITNSGNFLNMDMTPLSFIEGNVTLSKFDSKFKSIDSTFLLIGHNGQKDTIDRMQLMQTAWLKGSVRFNLLSLRTFSSQYFSVNVGARINVVNADSLFTKDKERDILFFDYYPELVYAINRVKNFGMEISLRWLQQRIADKEPFANKGWESVFNPQIAFYYYPGNNDTKKIYLRFNYFANKNKNANNFYQLQFGFKTGLKLSK